MDADWAEDPYGELLDLPPGDRPPHYYQLLELEIFCAHPERVRHAVRKQFRKVKPYQEHPDRRMREAIQDVMNRVAQARVVLSDPEKKEAYDRELAEQLGVNRQSVLAARMATPVPEFALTVSAGPTNVGDTIELLTDSVVTLGRDPHCVISLSSTRLGRLHGELRHHDDHWWYTHTEKGRITLIGDAQVTQQALEVGDRIEAGGYALRFREARDPATVAVPSSASGGLRVAGTLERPPITLIVTRGPSVPDAIFSALASEPILIGHCDTALWQLAGPMVSRHHCRVTFEADGWAVSDLRSTNCTSVNGERVTHCLLDDRDMLTIGRFEVMVRLRK